jgi:hypothetical protein
MGNAFAESMASCPFRSVPAHVPMFTLMGRPRAGALERLHVFAARGCVMVICSARTPGKAGKAVPLVRQQVATCRYSADVALMRVACGLCTAGAFMSSERRISGIKVAALACVRDRRKYGFVCGAHRFATLAVLEGGGVPRVAWRALSSTNLTPTSLTVGINLFSGALMTVLVVGTCGWIGGTH